MAHYRLLFCQKKPSDELIAVKVVILTTLPEFIFHTFFLPLFLLLLGHLNISSVQSVDCFLNLVTASTSFDTIPNTSHQIAIPSDFNLNLFPAGH